MVCSSQPVWAPLPEAALPPWEACDLQLPLPSVELPLAQPGWAPSPFGDATIALPPLPSLPLPPLPPLPALPAAAAASQLLDASSAESERSAKLEQRLEKMRAKNRRAQARYREKQKAKQQQFELQYASVAAELEEARRLNAELRAAVAAREAVKENWEAVEPLLRATASPQRPRQRCRCDDTASVAAGWQLHPFQKRVALYTQVGRQCELMQQLLEHGSSGPEPRSLEPSTKQELRQSMARSMPEVVANVQGTTLPELMKEWAAFCEFAQEVTSAVDGGRLRQEEAEERVRPAVEYIGVVKQMMLMHNSETYRQLLLQTRLQGESEDAATVRWRQMALACGITREQAEGMLPHYQLYLRRQAELGEELAGGMAALRRAQHELASSAQAPLQGSLSGIAARYLALFDAGGAVEHQTRSATLILHDFMIHTGRLLSPLQKARGVCYCLSGAGSGQRTAVYPDLVATTRAALEQYSLLAVQPGQ